MPLFVYLQFPKVILISLQRTNHRLLQVVLEAFCFSCCCMISCRQVCIALALAFSRTDSNDQVHHHVSRQRRPANRCPTTKCPSTADWHDTTFAPSTRRRIQANSSPVRDRRPHSGYPDRQGRGRLERSRSTRRGRGKWLFRLTAPSCLTLPHLCDRHRSRLPCSSWAPALARLACRTLAARA